MKKTDVYKNRFPHTCKIYRFNGEDEFTDGTKEVLYEGECAFYTNSTLRDFKSRNVEKMDYACDIPKLIKGIGGAVYLDGEDYGRKFSQVLLLKPQPVIYGNYEGTTVYFNMTDN